MSERTPVGLNQSLPAPIITLSERARLGQSLPASLSTLLGRDRDVAIVIATLSKTGVRLVTLTGPGGVGKTRLALEVGEQSNGAYADGVVYVPLGSIVDPKLVGPTIAHALGIREAGHQSIGERLAIALRSRHVLLILDNFEHVVEASPLIADLLTMCPDLTVLTTSRAVLRLSGEHIINVQPLRLPVVESGTSANEVGESSAVQLFVARATAVDADFRLTTENAGDVAEICRRVDGLPLAIELAAARIAHMSPADLRSRLNYRLPLLTGGPRDLPERQRTMREAIAWSYDLLSPEEQELFRRLAVFTGGYTVESAQSVLECSDAEALEGASSFVDKSFHRREIDSFGAIRYLMLDTVREFGWEQLLALNEDVVVRNRHAAYFTELAEQADPSIWGGSKADWWLARLETDLANFRSALTWLDESGDRDEYLRLAAGLGGVWVYRSHRVEGHNTLTRALRMGGDREPDARATALVKLSILERALGGSRAAEYASEAVSIRRGLGKPGIVGRALLAEASAYVDEGTYQRAIPILEEAAELSRSVDDEGGIARCQMLLGLIAFEQRKNVLAGELLAEALVLYRNDGFEYGIASVLSAIGTLEIDRGDLSLAAAAIAESLHLRLTNNQREGVVESLGAAARLMAKSGHWESAARFFGAADELGASLGYVMPKREREGYEVGVGAVRSAIDDHEFEQAWNTGRALSMHTATAEALAWLEAPALISPDQLPIPAGLTPRERDVLTLVADGLPDREVASALFVSAGTVRSHLTNIFAKLDVNSRTAAIAAARRLEIV